MATRGKDFEPTTQEGKLARIIVEDTIRSAYSIETGLKGLAVVKNGLEALQGEGGFELAGQLLGEYAGSLGALTSSAQGSDMDMRVFELATNGKGLNLAASPLRSQLIKQLEVFMAKPEKVQNAIATVLIDQQNNPVSQQ